MCYSGAWWEVDLEGSFQISSVKIYNRVIDKARLSNSGVQLKAGDHKARLSSLVVQLKDGDNNVVLLRFIGNTKNQHAIEIRSSVHSKTQCEHVGYSVCQEFTVELNNLYQGRDKTNYPNQNPMISYPLTAVFASKVRIKLNGKTF